MPTTRATNFLPDLDALDPAALDRAQIMYLCSPSNPQGAVADLDYLKKAIRLARKHDFLLVLDECYAEIYSGDTPPPGGLEAAVALGGSLDNIIVFHTLSKRSSVPGLRSGFAAGAPRTITLLHRLRSYAAAATPLATLDAATALWNDEAHVLENRAAYRKKFDIAERLLGGRFGFYRPGGGFYLWLDVGDGEEAAKKLWHEAAVKVLPGAYLTRPDPDGSNPNQAYIRIALVSDLETTEAGADADRADAVERTAPQIVGAGPSAGPAGRRPARRTRHDRRASAARAGRGPAPTKAALPRAAYNHFAARSKIAAARRKVVRRPMTAAHIKRSGPACPERADPRLLGDVGFFVLGERQWRDGSDARWCWRCSARSSPVLAKHRRWRRCASAATCCAARAPAPRASTRQTRAACGAASWSISAARLPRRRWATAIACVTSRLPPRNALPPWSPARSTSCRAPRPGPCSATPARA